MADTLEDGLRILRDAAEQAKSIKIEIDEEYLCLIARVEALPQNQYYSSPRTATRSNSY